jgi:hypothetical protein
MWQSLTELTLEAVPSSGVPEFLDALPSDFSGHGGSCKAPTVQQTPSKSKSPTSTMMMACKHNIDVITDFLRRCLEDP